MESGVEHGGMDSGMDGMASAPESMAMAGGMMTAVA